MDNLKAGVRAKMTLAMPSISKIEPQLDKLIDVPAEESPFFALLKDLNVTYPYEGDAATKLMDEGLNIIEDEIIPKYVEFKVIDNCWLKK